LEPSLRRFKQRRSGFKQCRCGPFGARAVVKARGQSAHRARRANRWDGDWFITFVASAETRALLVALRPCRCRAQRQATESSASRAVEHCKVPAAQAGSVAARRVPPLAHVTTRVTGSLAGPSPASFTPVTVKATLLPAAFPQRPAARTEAGSASRGEPPPEPAGADACATAVPGCRQEQAWECADTSALWNWETCLPVGKRRLVAALQSRPLPFGWTTFGRAPP
jgi:hypothetical protein